MGIRGYQHLFRYIEGDKVWYQHQDSNAWLGPVEIIFPLDNKVWIYVNRNIQKVAAVKVKPY